MTVKDNRNKATKKMTPLQCKMARTALGFGVRDLAALAEVSQDTVSRLERGEDLKDSTVAVISAALETAGVEFIPEERWRRWRQASQMSVSVRTGRSNHRERAR